jgi:GNAT superfamily N-acetyltransferase
MNEVEFIIEKRKPTKKILAKRRQEAAKTIRKKKTIIAENEAGERAGFISYEFSRAPPFGVDYGDWYNEYAWVSWSYVDKKWRKKGVGRALYAAVEKIARERGIKEVMLDVFEVNARSRAFHRKLGFSPLLSIYSKKIR